MKISTRSDYEEVLVSNIGATPEHFIQMKYEHSSWKVLDHQLPVANAFDKATTNLVDSVRTYTMLLNNLEPFYTSLQMLDEICIVGEPEKITPKTNYRVVKFSQKVFIKIEFVSPLCIDEASITFHGCTNTVKEMTEVFNSRCHDYEDENIYNKLLGIFDIPYFPVTDEDQVDCSICLSYRCEFNRCPIVCCDNEKCECTFHISCLEKYLRLQNQSLKILSICIGECPFCKQKLSNSYTPFFKRILAEDEKT